MSDKNMKTQEPKKDYLEDDIENKMSPEPIVYDKDYQSRNRFKGKHVVIIGGDSGIGKATAILFAQEGAEVTITYTNNEDKDAQDTKKIIDKYSQCRMHEIDVGDEESVEAFVESLDDFDYLIYNPAEQHYSESLRDITTEQLHRVFQTNVLGAFYFLIRGLNKLKDEGVIVFTTSVTAFEGHPNLIEYSATNGALTTLMRSLSQMNEIKTRNIRVNAVSPGPVWTPLIPATIPNHNDDWGEDTILEEYSQPLDIAHSYIYLCDPYQRHVTGQTIHVNSKSAD